MGDNDEMSDISSARQEYHSMPHSIYLERLTDNMMLSCFSRVGIQSMLTRQTM